MRVRISPSEVELRVEEGERLLDALDELATRAGLPTACRAGNCGACLVRIERGANALLPPSASELETLHERAAHPAERLGCQLQVKPRLEPDIELISLVIVGT